MTKEIADPMFKSMLPGPLASLHFTKVDFGAVPMRLSNVLATKTETNGIKLDLNVDWQGQCDIELDGNMIPTLVSSLGCPACYPTCTDQFNRESKVLNSRADSPSCCVL